MKQKWWVITGASINEANVWNKKKQENGKTLVPASGAFVLCERHLQNEGLATGAPTSPVSDIRPVYQ